MHPTRIVLESNWSFYDENSDEESASSSPPDFEDVMKTNANVGAYYSLKESGKGQKSDHAEDFMSSLFKIDGKLLECAISTIPFYERIDIDPSYFTAEEIEDQEQIANENEDCYRKMCEDRNKKLIKSKSKKLPEIQQRPVRFTDDTEFDTDSTRDERDDIPEGARSFHIVVEPVLKFKTTSESTGVVSTVEPESKESMQKWLDDLLS